MNKLQLDGRTEYYSFVGRFVTKFASLEGLIRFLIGQMSALDKPKRDLLIGYPRSGEARALAKKLAELQPLGTEEKWEVQSAFVQLEVLASLRDQLVHYGGLITPTGLVQLLAKAPKNSPEHNRTSQENLWNALRDLERIIYLLARHLWTDARPNIIDLIRPAEMQSAWLYKPPPASRTQGGRVPAKVRPIQPAP